jgi:hypothetical protein
MKLQKFTCLSLALPLLGLAAPAAQAQEQYELGGLAVFSLYKSANVASGPTTGSVGFQPGVAGGGFIGHIMNDRLGGEIRYLYAWNKLRLKSNGESTNFNAQSHIVNYDLLIYPTSAERRWRPFVAVGGGVKVFQGTGTENFLQPLSNLALLTKTDETLPTLDFGAGVRIQMGGNKVFRIEFRDYITEVPKVFDAAPGARISGILHHWVPAFGFSWTF